MKIAKTPTGWYFSFLLSLLFPSAQAQTLNTPGVALQAPSLCSVYVKQIYEDVNRYSNGVKDQ